MTTFNNEWSIISIHNIQLKSILIQTRLFSTVIWINFFYEAWSDR